MKLEVPVACITAQDGPGFYPLKGGFKAAWNFSLGAILFITMDLGNKMAGSAHGAG